MSMGRLQTLAGTGLSATLPINDGHGQKLAVMGATPFLVDGEMVALKPDVASF